MSLLPPGWTVLPNGQYHNPHHIHKDFATGVPVQYVNAIHNATYLVPGWEFPKSLFVSAPFSYKGPDMRYRATFTDGLSKTIDHPNSFYLVFGHGRYDIKRFTPCWHPARDIVNAAIDVIAAMVPTHVRVVVLVTLVPVTSDSLESQRTCGQTPRIPTLLGSELFQVLSTRAD